MVRQTVDLVVVLCLGVLLFRTFSAEAYVVPTGSMAPTLMGHHRELTCPNCGFVFVIGVDEEGHPPRPVCPNCGKKTWNSCRRWSATATGCWCRSSSTIFVLPGAGRWPSFISRASRPRPM